MKKAVNEDDRRVLFTAANKYAREVRLSQDSRFQRCCKEGAAATASRRFGGDGVKRRAKPSQGGSKARRTQYGEWSFAASSCLVPSKSVGHLHLEEQQDRKEEHLQQLQAWAVKQPPLHMQPEDVLGLGQAIVTGFAGGGGARSMHVKSVECKPPSKLVLQATLDAAGQAEGKQGRLEEHWGKLHDTVWHDRAPVRPTKAQIKIGKERCLMSRRCVCHLGKGSMVMRLQSVLKDWFRKGAMGRPVYSEQGAVFCLSRGGLPDNCSRWFFVGCGDLRKHFFITQELVPCDRSIALGALPSSSHLLECVLSGSRARPHPLFTLDVDPAGSWHVQLFRLLFDSDVAMKTFRPVALVQAVSDVVAFWTPGDPPRPRRPTKLPIKPLSLGVSQLPLLDIVPDEEGGPGGVHVAAANNAIAAGDPDVGGHAGDAVSSSDEDVRRGADGIGGVLDDSDAAGDAWEVSSSDEDEADGGAHLFFRAARHLFISSKTNTRDGGSNEFEEKH